MAKVSVVYTADPDDQPYADMAGHRFFDGVPVELDPEDNEADAHFLSKLPGNRFFSITGGDETPVRFTPSKADNLAKARAAKAAKNAPLKDVDA